MSRDHVVSVRLTVAERAHLDRRAAAAGCSPSEYLRRTVLSPPVPTEGQTSAAPNAMVIWADPANQTGGPAVIWEDGTAGPTWHSPDWPGAA